MVERCPIYFAKEHLGRNRYSMGERIQGFCFRCAKFEMLISHPRHPRDVNWNSSLMLKKGVWNEGILEATAYKSTLINRNTM